MLELWTVMFLSTVSSLICASSATSYYVYIWLRIYVPTKRRTTLDPVKVAQLAERILDRDQTTPIMVREDGERFVRVEGLHWLALEYRVAPSHARR
jgi:hypothetical protein